MFAKFRGCGDTVRYASRQIGNTLVLCSTEKDNTFIFWLLCFGTRSQSVLSSQETHFKLYVYTRK